MFGYSLAEGCNFLIRNIKFWNFMANNPNFYCNKKEAEEQAEYLRQELYAHVKSYSLSDASIKRLEDRGLIRKHGGNN